VWVVSERLDGEDDWNAVPEDHWLSVQPDGKVSLEEISGLPESGDWP
jgi:hypothetical protein